MNKSHKNFCQQSPTKEHKLSYVRTHGIDYVFGSVVNIYKCIYCHKIGQKKKVYEPNAIYGLKLKTDDDTIIINDYKDLLNENN